MISITGGLQAMYNSNMREKTPLELEQELSQAKNRIRDLLKSETEYKLENERLNNIINELEKWLLEENKKKQKWYNEQLSTNDKRYYNEKYLTSLTMINVFFDKLQELKENKQWK